MTTAEIRAELFRLQDAGYKAFQGALIPTVDPDRMIGVRTPALRALAKRLLSEGAAESFLSELPHLCFEENQLHAFILSEIKDFDRCLAEVDRFLSYVDNWATADQLNPKAFRRHREALLPFVRRALASGETYRIRFGIKVLMDHFAEEAFDPVYLDLVAAVDSEEYYVKMMVAWYFATLLAKRYEETLPYLEQGRLPLWTHNMAIRKATESFRIPAERKVYLRTLKRSVSSL